MTTPMQYVARPIEVDAIELTQYGDFTRAVRWIIEGGGDAVFSPAVADGASDCIIMTVNGVTVDVPEGSFIVRTPGGLFHPMHKEAFRQQFELADVPVTASSSGVFERPRGPRVERTLRGGATLRLPEAYQ